VITGKHLPGDRQPVRPGDAAVDALFCDHVNGERGDTVLMVTDLNLRMIGAHGRVLAGVVPRSL